MYLNIAKKMLNNEYKTNYPLATLKHQRDFMNEKIKHSYQVLGAGNFILKHEPCFEKCVPDEFSFLQAIVLLHDVARFSEALTFKTKAHFDHGTVGAQMLAQTKEFNTLEATLPVKHHGHLIEKLYEDEEYKKLPQSKQQTIRRNAFLVRDADKIANFYLIAYSFPKIRNVFFVGNSFPNARSKDVSKSVLEDFMAHRSINKKEVKNFADHALMITAWIYDINYKSSFTFMERTKIIDKLFAIFSEFWKKEDMKLFRQHLQKFITEKTS